MSYLNVARKHASEMQAGCIEQLVKFLQGFDFYDATDDNDRRVSVSKPLLYGLLVIKLPMESGEGFDVGYYIGAEDCLQSFYVHSLREAVELAAAMMALSINVTPKLAGARTDLTPVELPVQQPMIREEPIPSYFGDPVDIETVPVGVMPEELMQKKAEKFGAAVLMQLEHGVVATFTIVASKTLEQAARVAEACTGWTVMSQCVYSKHEIIEQPVCNTWADAKFKCMELAEEHGHAVVVDNLASDGTNDGFRIIAGESAEAVADLLGEGVKPEFERSRDFPEHNTP